LSSNRMASTSAGGPYIVVPMWIDCQIDSSHFLLPGIWAASAISL
jgi:hypothetical protein